VVAKSQIAPLIAIVGETASGKSSLALQLAQRFDGEIICADAWSLRRGVDIGTAKPSIKDRQIVEHHLLDIIEPNESFNAARFQLMANQAIDKIYARGKLPVMVGGTGLYIDSLLYDYGFLLTADQHIRQEATKLTNNQIVDRLKSLNIDLTGLDLNNRHRLIRLLETGGAKPEKNTLRANTLLLGINIERGQLNKRLDDRLKTMFELGLKDEVKSLVDQYGWSAEALRGIGYSEWKGYFNGQINEANVANLIKKNSLSLAKRQKTWFKRNKSIHWFDTPVNLNDVVDLITTYFQT
jgi:tRNA dimethylallyltransferase